MEVQVRKEKIVIAHVREVAEKLNLAGLDGFTDDALVVKVAEELANRHPGASLLECSECRFPAPDSEDIDRCPGCGESFTDSGEDSTEEDDESEGEGETDVGKAGAAKAGNKGGKGAKGAKAAKGGKGAKGAKGGDAASAGKGTPATRPQLEAVEGGKGKGGKKGAAAENAVTETSKPIEPTEVITPISPAEAKRRLEVISEEIAKMRTDLAHSGWDIGDRLKEVYDRDLWKAGFESFADYVEKKCGFSAQTGRDFMGIARNFKREDIGTLTITQLRLLIKAPEGPAREELVEQARTGQPTKRELADQVRAKREEANLNTERRGLKGVVVNARLEPGLIAEGKWTKYEAGKGKGRFKIGDQTFIIETNKQHGFKVTLVKPKD